MNNKKIVYHVTKEYMKQNKKRTFTTFLGIVCMVMLMTCVFVGKDTAVSYLQKLASYQDGKWHVSVYDINAEKYEQIKGLESIAETAASADYGYSELPQSQKADRPFIQIKAYSEKCFDWMNIRLAEGRFPENGKELVLCKSAVEDGADLQIGDTISADCFRRILVKIGDMEEKTTFPYFGITLTKEQPVEVPQGFPYFGKNDSFMEEHEDNGYEGAYQIVGFIEPPNFEKTSAAAYTAITCLDEAEGLPKQFNMVAMLDLNGADTYYQDLLACSLEDTQIEVNNYVLAFTAGSKDSTINGMVGVMTMFFVIFIMAASVVLIYNVFNMSFEERSRYLGMLSSVGATGRQKRSSVYYEAFSLLGMAFPMGFVIGLLVVKLGMMALKPFIDKMMGMVIATETGGADLQISLNGILVTLLLSVITVAVSAFLPARKIGKIGPIECIRGNVTGKQKLYPVNKMGLQWFGAEGMLAGNVLQREKKKTRGLVGAVTVFMVILIVTVFSTRALTHLIDFVMLERVDIKMNGDYDYTVWDSSTDGSDISYQYQDLKEEILESDDVEDTLEYMEGMFVGNVPIEVYSSEYWEALRQVAGQYGYTQEEYESMIAEWEGRPVSVIGVDKETFRKLADLTGTSQEFMKNSDAPGVIVMQSGEVCTQNWFFENGTADYKLYQIDHMTDLQIGEEIPIGLYNPKTEEEEIYPVTIAGYATNEQVAEYMEFHTDQMWMITDMETAELMDEICKDENADPDAFYSNTFWKFMDVRMKNMDSSLGRQLQELANEEGLVTTNTRKFNMTLVEALNSIIRIMLVCFVLLTSIICLLNLYNSIRGRIVGKKKEFAILQSVGMTRNQLQKMMLLESSGILLKGIFFATLVSTPLVFFVKKMLVNLFGYVELEFPWAVYLIAMLIATLAVFTITLCCYRFEKTENILEDIRTESV